VTFDPDRIDRRDPRLIRTLLPVCAMLNQRYFRLRCEGLEHVTPGAALFVSNHNGGIAGPDLACTLGTLWERLGAETPLYMLAHDFAMRQFTPLGRVLQRLGAVRASPQNAARVLASGSSALVYPGGDLEAYRHSRRRDEIVFGSRTGFIRVAQRMGVPLVPIVAQGAHRSAYIFHDGAGIAQTLGLERWARVRRFPLALALPWGVALGPWTPYLPLPFPIRLRVLAPMRVDEGVDLVDAREELRRRMQSALHEMAREVPS
jgi:1-acyl-sn-glycerol-3-phosphate acyltransferase